MFPQKESLIAKIYTTILVCLVFTLVFVGYFHPITAMSQDLGRHFLLGNIILETRWVPLTNLFSYTYPDFPFINLHWLSEVIFYLLFKATGFTGLLLFTTSLVVLAFTFIFLYSLRKGHILVVTISALLYLPILFERTDLRPEIFSFLFLAIYIIILFKYRTKFTKWIFILIPLSLLWVNMHIYFIVGVGVLGLFLIDNILQHRTRLVQCLKLKKGLPRQTAVLLLVFLAGALVTIGNPNFILGAIYPFRVFDNYGYTIEENQTVFLLESLGLNKPSFPYLKISALFLTILLLINVKRSRPIDWFLTIVFTYLAFSAVRNLPLFVFATFIPFTDNLSALVTRIPSSKPYYLRFAKIFCFIMLVLFFTWQISTLIAKKGFGATVPPGAERAVDFFIAAKLNGPIYNNFDIGSYLEYRLYPKERVFVDGRPGEYPSSFFQKIYIPMQQDEKVFKEVEKKYRFSTIFFSHTDQTPWGEAFLQTILKNPSWKPVYLDQTVIIFAKNTPTNQAIIRRFGINPTHLKGSYDPHNKQSLLQLASFFSKIGDTESLFPLLQQILALDPKNCQALYNRAAIAQSRQDPLSSMYATSYENICGTQLLQ